LSGRKVVVPVLGREIPVIADEYVDREFGTGALKITPGHDPNDYAIGERHGLPLISMLDKEAAVNENGGPYAGQDRFEAARSCGPICAAAGLVIKGRALQLNVPRSQRGGEIVEPMVSTQWFVRIEPLAEKPWKPCAMGASASCPSASPRCITTGWRTSRIGASAASCGGDTASRSGTARTAAR
jgi:valyl-tRNA synthetase